uniref:Uncharacterized protein n=1 Tax=Arundo donax TaxID=35708 RepID=A0A0A9H195_ARUDO
MLPNLSDGLRSFSTLILFIASSAFVTSKGIDRFAFCVKRMAFGGKGKTLLMDLGEWGGVSILM